MQRTARFLVLLACVSAGACASSTPPPGSAATTASAPDWVHKGTHVEKRRIIGVGFAGGISNTELARVTATNRARNEIAKILEVYSASLMKDYQESVKANGPATTESQLVAQAIKTFTQELIEGSEVGGYWFDPGNDTWHGMVVLDFDRQRDIAAASAKMPENTRKWVEENSDEAWGDVERSGPSATEQRAPSEEGETSAAKTETPASSAAPTARSPDVRDGGTPPAWTKSKSAPGTCDPEKFLCGVGTGRTMDAADIAARAELARIFESNIRSVATSFEASVRRISSAAKEQWAEAQTVASYSAVSTDKVVRISEIRERWRDPNGVHFTLAIIDRAQAANALRDRMQEIDRAVGDELGRAKNEGDKLKRFRILRRAVALLAEREALNSDLRVVDRSGRGVEAPHSLAEVQALLEGAASDLSIGIALAGSGADRLQACLEEGLTARGYEVSARAQEEEDDDPDMNEKHDVIIKGSVKAEKRGAIAGSEVVDLSLTLKMVNGATSKVVKTITATKRASRGDVRSAAATAVYQMCTQKMPEVLSGIDQYFTKR